MDDNVPEVPRPRRAASPPPEEGPKRPENAPGEGPQRARRSLGPLPGQARAAETGPAEPTSPARPTTPSADPAPARSATPYQSTSPYRPGSPDRPLSPTSPTGPLRGSEPRPQRSAGPAQPTSGPSGQPSPWTTGFTPAQTPTSPWTTGVTPAQSAPGLPTSPTSPSGPARAASPWRTAAPTTPPAGTTPTGPDGPTPPPPTSPAAPAASATPAPQASPQTAVTPAPTPPASTPASPDRPSRRSRQSPAPAPDLPQSLTETGITAAITAEQEMWRPPGTPSASPTTPETSPGSPTTGRTDDTTGLSRAVDTTGTITAAETTSGIPAVAASGDSAGPGAGAASPTRPAASGVSTPPAPAPATGGGGTPPRGKGPSRAMDGGGGFSEWLTRRNIVIGAIALVVVIGVVVTTVLFRARTSGPTATGTQTFTGAPILSAASLLTAADAQRLDGGTTWTETLTQTRADSNTPRPNCLTTDAQGVPLPQATMVRNIQGGGDANTNLLNEAFQFGSVQDATTAAAIWTAQLGGCERPVSYLEGGWTVSNVGDSSAGVSATVQDKTSVHHTVMLSRSGSVITVVDASKPNTTPDGAVVAGLLGTAVGHTCQAAGGTCPTDPTAASGVPPKTATDPEFLATADFPRITAGTGRWGATDPSTSFDFIGSQCEGKDLANVAGPTARKHRAYLLQEDAAAPQTFGVDEYVLTFPDRASADSLVKDVSGSIDGCEKAMLTAKVQKTDDVGTKGAGGKDVTGRTWVVTQQVNQTSKQKYRLALVQIDNTVIYLLAPTGDSFDFDNGQWKSIGDRAGVRFSLTL